MKKEEKTIFLYFCTQRVKEKRGKSKPHKRKPAEKRKSHMPDIQALPRVKSRHAEVLKLNGPTASSGKCSSRAEPNR